MAKTKSPDKVLTATERKIPSEAVEAIAMREYEVIAHAVATALALPRTPHRRGRKSHSDRPVPIRTFEC